MKKVLWYIPIIAAAAVCGVFFGFAAYNHWTWEYLGRVARTKSSILYTRYSCAAANLVLPGHRNCEVQMGRAEYRALRVTLRLGPGDYNSFGDYLSYGGKYWGDAKFDSDHVPLLRLGRDYEYNPVLTANYALSMYDRGLQGDKNASSRFLKATGRLLALQDKQGAFRYQYRWKYYLSGKDFQPGWVSGMAQGVGLSVLARAYHLTGDPRYLAAGNKALDFLLVPVAQGGTTDSLADLDPALGSYLFYDEFPATPSGYTLNGFMVAVLGLYDWSQLPGDHQAKAAHYFQEGIRTLKRILPYYDLGGFTTYDLGHITYHSRPKLAAEYHAVHIELLWALADLTHDPELRHYQDLWTSYIAGVRSK